MSPRSSSTPAAPWRSARTRSSRSRPTRVAVTDFDGNPVEAETFEVAWDASAAEKGGWSSFMAKEISEEPEAVANTLLGRVARRRGRACPSSTASTTLLAGIDRIIIIACGTAAYAGHARQVRDREVGARSRSTSSSSHEFRYRDPVLDADTLVVSISQSGETMDTLMAVKYARERGAKHALDLQHAGRDDPARVGRRALHARRPRGRRRVDQGVRRPDHRALPARPAPRRACAARSTRRRGRRAASPSSQAIPAKIAQVLESSTTAIEQLAHWMADTRSVLFLGRHVGYPIALEGALKLKELAYIHAEGFAAGELKHGPIALIEPGQPVFVDRAEPARPGVAAPEGRLEHPGDPRPRRPRHRDRRGGRRRRAAVRRRGASASRSPAPLFEPLLAVVPLHIFAMELADGQGPRRRPAAQPRQVRHGRVDRMRMIVGIGVDVVDLARFERALARTPALRRPPVR